MAHYEVLLELGFDYGADGGQGWATEVTEYPNGASVRNSDREHAIGTWQLGNRTVSNAEYETLQAFFHAMRGQAHTFNYKDWNDYEAVNEQLVNTGEATLQLTKTYGLAINGWVRTIKKLKADSVTIYIGGVEQTEGGGNDYTLDDTTGIITWASPPDTSDVVTWSGEFYVPCRFDRDLLTAQFIGYEERDSGVVRAYELGALAVIEDPEA